ncbi:Superkiller protein 3 [Tulasnella sp. 427]|nr:Superkiller protein 3 [Tulasnella sp. 427]
MSIEVDSKSPTPWTNLGLLYLYHDDLELANHAFYRAQTLDPDYSLAWIGQAIVATRNSHTTEARALLEHSITLSAAIPEADLEFASRLFGLYVKGTLQAGDHDVLFLPFGVLDRYSQQRPDDATASHLFALICERLGQRDLAITLMEKVTGILDAAYNKTEDSETERHFALAQVNVGRLRLAQSEYSDATEALKVGLSLLPQGTEDEVVILLRAHASYCLGLACFQLGEYGEALETLEAALEQTPAHLVAVRGQIIQLQSQTLWQLGSDEAREAGKTQLLTAITENSRNMDAITALAAYGMLSLDDDLLNAALSEIRAMPIDEQRKLDPEGTVEHLLTHHHLGQGLVDDAVALMKASVHAAPMALRPRLRLARLLIRQGHPDQARAVLAGLLHAEGPPDRSHGAETLSLAALALAQSKAEGSKATALKEAQRAVFLDPSSLQARNILRFCRLLALQLASSSYHSNPAWIAARLAPTSSTSHCYYLRRGYSASPTPSTSTTPSTPKDNLASPNNASSPRKKIDLHPAPRRPTAAEVATAPLKPPPPAPSPSTTQSGSTLEKASATDASPETDQASAIRLAIEDMQKATQHGILTPPPEDAGTVRRLLHQGIQLFKFYLRGIKLIGVHRKTVLDIRKRLAAEKAEGKEPRLTRWESQFIKTYRQDLKKLVPFLLIVLIIEEIIPLIVMYVPGILPSTCILPSQLERIHAKAETTRKDAIKTVSSILKDVKMEDLKQRVSGGLNSLDGALLKQLCRVFGQGSWGPGLFARRRLERHLDYLKTDDALLAAEGKGIRLSVPELRIALGDRGFVADGLAESALRSKLANWVDATKNKEDAERLQIVLKNLVFGPRQNEPQNVVGGGLLEALAGKGFEGLANARRLGEWIEQAVTEENASFLVDFEPPWLGPTPNPVQLELTKTSVEAFWIFTSLPRTTIPKYIPPPKQEDVLLTSLKAPPSPILEIQPPLPPPWAEAPADPAQPGESKAPYVLPPVKKEPELRWLTSGAKMVEHIKNYPWKNHALGPMERWPQSLKSSLSAVLAAPYPWAVWWGPDLALLYNDAYATMCGSKHPGLFAKAGKIGK